MDDAFHDSLEIVPDSQPLSDEVADLERQVLEAEKLRFKKSCKRWEKKNKRILTQLKSLRRKLGLATSKLNFGLFY